MNKTKFGGLVLPDNKEEQFNDIPTEVCSQIEGLNYKIPFWGENVNDKFKYFLEIIKEGKQIDIIEFNNEESILQDKGWLLIGRLPPDDKLKHYTLLHPSISRQHAVFQMKSNGQMFIYDLGSTHGTFLNKRKIKPRAYIPLRCGDLIKFGQSSRLYHFTSHSDIVLENIDLDPDALIKQVKENPQLYSGSYSEVKTYIKQFKNEKKKQKQDEDSDEDMIVDEDDEIRNQLGNNDYFLGVDEYDDTDDFYDRVKSSKKTFTRKKNPILSNKSLKNQIINIQSSIDNLRSKIDSISSINHNDNKDENIDVLDSYLNEEITKENDINKMKLEKELIILLKEKENLEKQSEALSNPLDRIMPLKRQRDINVYEDEPVKKQQKLSFHSLDESIEDQIDNEDNNNEYNNKIVKRLPESHLRNETSKKKKKKKKPEKVKLDSDDPSQYIEWVPPKNQKGDGMTYLNEKFGY